MKRAREVAARAVCLGAIEFRARFESARDRPDAGAMVRGVTDWLRDAGLWPSLVKAERGLMSRPPLTWDRASTDAIKEALLLESVGTLLAMLNRYQSLPAGDQRFDDSPLQLLPFLAQSPFVTREGMHPKEEWEAMATAVDLVVVEGIAFEEEIASLWWWRAVSESLVRAGRLSRADLDQTLAQGAPRCRQLQIPLVGGDFHALDQPYAKLAPAQHTALSKLAESRVRALRWLLVDVPWDQVPMHS